MPAPAFAFRAAEEGVTAFGHSDFTLDVQHRFPSF